MPTAKTPWCPSERRRSHVSWIAGVVLAGSLAAGCDDPDGNDAGAGDGDGDGDVSLDICFEDAPVELPEVDESACVQRPTDYRPLDADGDMWAPCVTDDGDYVLAGTDAPGSLGRVAGYEQIADLLWRPNAAPAPEDFTAARTVYDADENLGSRIARREDLHYPEIPAPDRDPAVDSDKQCTVTGNPQKFPERCAGPALMAPIVESAFAAGQRGEGVPEVHAARIQATLLWFFYLSIYKEAYTCATVAAKDCDSMWAKYTGGQPRDAATGYAGEVKPRSEVTHQHTYDALLGMRCWRDLYPADEYPTLEDLPPDGRARFEQAWETLDDALHRTWAVILRDRLEHLGEACSVQAAADWAFIQVAAAVIDRELADRSPTDAAALRAAVGAAEPTAEDVEAAAVALDAAIACPQP